MCIRFFVVLIYCIGISFAHAQDSMQFDKATASLSDTEKELLKGFQKVAPKIQSFYVNLQLEADMFLYEKSDSSAGVVKDVSKEELQLTAQTRLSFYVSNGLWSEDTSQHYYRLDIVDYGKQSPSDSPEDEWITIASPNNSYVIQKVDYNENKRVGILSEQVQTSAQTVSQHFFTSPLASAPYAHFGIPITRWMLESDDVTIKSVSEDQSLPDPIVTVVFDKHYDKGDAHYEYRFMKKTGALLYAKKTVGFSKTREGGFLLQNTYEGEIEGIPLLKQVIYEEFSGEKKGVMTANLRKRYEVTNLVPGAPQLAVFDVDQFLTEPVGKMVRWSYFRIFSLLSGIVLLLIAIYLMFRKEEN